MTPISKPTVQEAEGISQMHRKSWHETYDGILPRDKIEEILDQSEADQIRHFQEVSIGNRPEHVFFVAKDDNENIVGFSDIRVGKEYTEVIAMYILKGFQRRGIGTEMLLKSLEKVPNSCQVTANIIIENRPAIRFFEKHGFNSNGNMESIGGIRITTLVFEK
jgi:ribosomal protein S18 acetylase RimI-like enzyme